MPGRRIRFLNTTPLAHAAGKWLAGQLELGAAREKTLKLGFDIALSWTTGMALVAVVSRFLGCAIPGLVSALAAFGLRVFSAGAHCGTAGRCALLMVFVYPVIGRVGVLVHERVPAFSWVAAVYGLSAACTYMRARPRDPRDVRNRRFQPVAVGVLAAYLVFSSLNWRRSGVVDSTICGVALGCLWQSVTVTEPGARLVRWIDRVMSDVGIE
ncbi:MAG: accessory gene regulator ArgB-like protein [Ignavibacteriales bacterium]